MLFALGKKTVIGNKPNDNKDPKNKQKTTRSASQMGTVGPHAGNTKIATQNSKETSEQSDENTTVIDKNAGYSKKPTKGRQTLYSDGAMAAAKRQRGVA